MNQVVRDGWRVGARLDLPAPTVYWPSPTSFPYILPVSAARLPHILLVRFSAMGDILLMTPLLRTLRVRHPEAAITVVTKQSHLPLLEHNPRVSHLIGYDPATPLRALARQLRGERFTHRLDLHGSVRSLALRWLVGGRWTGYPKHRLARAILVRTKRPAVYRDQRPVAERYFDAARELDVRPDGNPPEFFIPRVWLHRAEEFLRARGLGIGRTLMAVAPGAAHATKRWPLQHWRALVARLTASGNDVVVIGGRADRELGDRVAAVGGDRAVNAAGPFEVAGSAALLKLSRSVTCGDTGVMHLATAVGTPVLGLFGPTVEAFGFFPYRARASVLQRDLPCRPCSAMGGARCPLGHHRCLMDLGPEEVFEALRQLPPAAAR